MASQSDLYTMDSSAKIAVQTELLPRYIDHTLLRPEATQSEIEKLCDEAKEHGFYSVCIERRWLKLAHARLVGSGVKAITVIGFPLGSDPTAIKREQVREALAAGAEEVDMVLNRAWLRERDYASVYQDIRAVVEEARNIPVKVILETSELTDEEKSIACALASAAQAAFVKTSTGFSKSGATEADVRRMRAVVGERMGVKASGGVRTYADAQRMIEAGASRLGTSASVAIVRGEKDTGKGGY